MPVMPGANWKPIGSHGGAMDTQLGLILHVTTNHFSPYGFFSNPSNQASSTWWVAEDGSIEQYVDSAVRGWAQAGGNASYCSVETSGVEGDHMTPAQVEAVAQIYAWGHRLHGWPLHVIESAGEVGFGWHGMGGSAWGGHYNCPGVRKTQRQQIIDRAGAILGGGTPDPTPEPEDDEMGFILQSDLGFLHCVGGRLIDIPIATASELNKAGCKTIAVPVATFKNYQAKLDHPLV